MPLDMPYTDWVLQYQYYNDETAKAWVASKYQGRERQLWLCTSLMLLLLLMCCSNCC